MLYQQATTNPIGVTAASATNIGYLSENRTQLEVVGQLTGQDPTDMYSFTFQQGSSINASLTNIEGANVHVQIYDGSGTRLLADNQGAAGSSALAAWNQLTSTQGLSLNPGKYIVKVTYASGTPTNQAQNYALQFDSGTTFTADYRTLAAATTVNATLLAGGSVGYNSASLTASMLTNVANGTSLSIFDTLSSNASLLDTVV